MSYECHVSDSYNALSYNVLSPCALEICQKHLFQLERFLKTRAMYQVRFLPLPLQQNNPPPNLCSRFSHFCCCHPAFLFP
ncbi:hypothetical protein L596_030760 [Steinernema carpocapsae]|uniref:Uncharacterized protein n=1 Tax=Steinernema carpocapsae TaxID=34508 RepID=A0A4U5LNN8_STECR|nr:hypothetical protein L596_030760 [Steinernema carpocapsae]